MKTSKIVIKNLFGIRETTLLDGYTTEDVKNQLTAAVGELLASQTFGEEVRVPFSRFLACLLQCPGVADYAKDDCCTHDGHVWRSGQDNNVWAPGTAGAKWNDLGEIEEVMEAG